MTSVACVSTWKEVNWRVSKAVGCGRAKAERPRRFISERVQ